jgi:hypothetical protein
MSRWLEIPFEHSRDPRDRDRDGGCDIPRGSRSGGSDRSRDRKVDAKDALVQQLDIPRTEARERVFVGDRDYALRESEIRVLATVGAFRVVDSRDLATGSADARNGDLAHLREQKLIRVVGPQFRDGDRSVAVTLTKEGRALLERHQRTRDDEPRQAFYCEVAKLREMRHDAQLYRAYEQTAKRLQEGDCRIRRVVLDYELKREYQRFLQAHNRGNRRSSGRPDRSPEEIAEWASRNGLPSDRGHVQFPDVRIEYEHPDGRPDHEDIELATEHYNSRQMAAKCSSGFTICRGASSHSSSSPFDPHAAERVLR